MNQCGDIVPRQGTKHSQAEAWRAFVTPYRRDVGIFIQRISDSGHEQVAASLRGVCHTGIMRHTNQAVLPVVLRLHAGLAHSRRPSGVAADLAHPGN